MAGLPTRLARIGTLDAVKTRAAVRPLTGCLPQAQLSQIAPVVTTDAVYTKDTIFRTVPSAVRFPVRPRVWAAVARPRSTSVEGSALQAIRRGAQYFSENITNWFDAHPRFSRLIAMPGLLMLGVMAPPVGVRAAATQSGTGIDLKNLDLTVRPQDDFYQFVNGGWFAANPIPPGEPAWSSFGELRLANQQRFQTLLHEAMRSDAPPGSVEKLLGDFYFSGMDVSGLNAAGAQPLAPFLDQIGAIRSIATLQDALAWLNVHKMGGVFGLTIDLDPKQSDQYALILDQAGLGLPERDYYSRDDEGSIQLRQAYFTHLLDTFALLGDDAHAAYQKAAAVMEIETALAQSSLTSVERRDLDRQYNKMSLPELKALAPHMDWERFFASVGAKDVSQVIVTHPDFLKTMDGLLAHTSISNWQAYLTWQWVNAASDCMGDAFVNRKFDFYGKTLEGVNSIKPRWRRVLEQADTWLGDALGQVFVARYFPQESKVRVNDMVDNLLAVFRDRIQTRDWMSEETKVAALAKLDKVTRKIGFPDQWKDYSTVAITRDSYLANALSARAYEFARMVDHLGRPIDRSEWSMTAPTVNAEYDFGRNQLLFPAGILQPPFFDAVADDAMIYGAIGAVIGHEMTHGFDDQGAKFDANGNMVNWWTAADKAQFDARTAQVVAQFNQFVAIGDLHVNGQLTLGENVADLGGLVIAYHALQRSLEGKPRTLIDGYTPEQRFFMAWAQVWRVHYTPQVLDKFVRTNVHSPGIFRVLGPLSNMKEFHDAWGVKEGDAMSRPPKERTEIW